MRLKKSIRIEYRAEQRLRITTYHITAELEHPEISQPFCQALQTTRELDPALSGACCSASLGDQLRAFLDEHRCFHEFPDDTVTVEARYAAAVINRDLDYWADSQYCDGFWERLLRPTEARDLNLVYAWGVESHHHTHSVLRHLGEVLRHTEERGTINKCLTHMNEEWDHPYLFKLSALRLRKSRGLPDLPGELLPLAGTRSLCNLLQHAARKHMFAYKCCAAVLEKTASRTQETRTLFAQAATAHNIDYSVVEPFVKHAETDDHYDHLNSLAAFAELCPPLPLDLVADSMRLAYRFAEALYLWNCHMMDWYLVHQPGEGHRRRA